MLAGLFWLQKGQANVTSEARNVTGLVFFEMMFLSFRAMLGALFTFPTEFKMLLKVREYLFLSPGASPHPTLSPLLLDTDPILLPKPPFENKFSHPRAAFISMLSKWSDPASYNMGRHKASLHAKPSWCQYNLTPATLCKRFPGTCVDKEQSFLIHSLCSRVSCLDLELHFEQRLSCQYRCLCCRACI